MKKNNKSKAQNINGFTLAEILITLAIIGIIAAITIPSVISNTQQQEFKTGLKKAVSVLNSSISLNIALEGESPYDNQDTFEYLQRHLSVIKSTSKLPYNYTFIAADGTKRSWGTNAAFYTNDGFRFETEDVCSESCANGPKLHESDVKTCIISSYIVKGPMENWPKGSYCHGCGSYGLTNNPNNTTKPPCILLVDVNGDRKPSPSNVNCNNTICQENNFYKYPSADSKTVTDIFAIMITEDRALPFGVVAQRAMYQAQK